MLPGLVMRWESPWPWFRSAIRRAAGARADWASRPLSPDAATCGGRLRLPGRQLGGRRGRRREVALADSLHAESARRAWPAWMTHSRRRWWRSSNS